MLKWMMIFASLVILALICFGCSWTTERTPNETVIRCPKCAAFFSSKEGAETFEWMRAEPRETRR